MSIEIIYFVHGTTVDNARHISSGWKDAELSELGIEQSRRLPSQNTEIFDVVFCSDLKRAIKSAIISFEGKVPIVIDTRLRECNYGDYNGKPSEIVEPLQEQMINDRFPGGESYEDVRERVAEFLDDITKKYNGKHIAIVGHKAPQLALEVLLKGTAWDEAFAADWRKSGKWQPGWEYLLK
jgi:broad specificity phosphatase PhoE